MKKLLNYIKNHLLCSYVIINLLLLFITSLFHTFRVITYKDLSLTYIPALILNIIVILIYLLIKKKKKEKYNLNIFDIFLFIFFVFTLISSILSINTETAFFGFNYRFEGFFQITYYFSLFLLSSFLNKDEKKIICYTIITLGIFGVVYAHLQKFELFNIPIIYKNGKPWAFGFTSNPNFFGSIALLLLSISLGLLFSSNNKKEKIINLVLISLFFSGLLISDTLSALLGLIVVLIYVLIYALKKKETNKFIVIVIILTIISTIHSLVGSTVLINDIIKTKDQTIEIAKGNIKDNYGSNRIFIWKESIKVVPKNITYGVGVDNFYYAFGDKPLMKKNKFYDKAHNEYLQILVCEGLYALISYLLFLGVILVKGIKNSFKDNKLYLVIPVIGYMVQAFFNVSVIEVAPIFYICLGLCSNRIKEN